MRDSDSVIRFDREGQELPDLKAAYTEVVNANREMLGERLLHGGSLGLRQIKVADQSGQVLTIVTAREVMLRDGQLRALTDDVIKSAPAAQISAGEKTAPE